MLVAEKLAEEEEEELGFPETITFFELFELKEKVEEEEDRAGGVGGG